MYSGMFKEIWGIEQRTRGKIEKVKLKWRGGGGGGGGGFKIPIRFGKVFQLERRKEMTENCMKHFVILM